MTKSEAVDVVARASAVAPYVLISTAVEYPPPRTKRSATPMKST